MWLRLHRPPKSVSRIREEFRNSKLRWLFARSKDRYDRWPEGIHTNDALRSAMRQGEIGRIEGVRFIV
jgi:hypothetical protein